MHHALVPNTGRHCSRWQLTSSCSKVPTAQDRSTCEKLTMYIEGQMLICNQDTPTLDSRQRSDHGLQAIMRLVTCVCNLQVCAHLL